MSPCNQWVRSSTAHIRCLRIINLSRRNVGMPEKFLNRADIITALEKLRCEAVGSMPFVSQQGFR